MVGRIEEVERYLSPLLKICFIERGCFPNTAELTPIRGPVPVSSEERYA
jgi:hypothetical protein